MVPAKGSQDVAPKGPRTPAEDIELLIPLGEEIRKVATALVVPERRVRAAVVAFLQPQVEALAAGKVAEIFQRDLSSRLGVSIPGPITFDTPPAESLSELVMRTAGVNGD